MWDRSHKRAGSPIYTAAAAAYGEHHQIDARPASTDNHRHRAEHNTSPPTASTSGGSPCAYVVTCRCSLPPRPRPPLSSPAIGGGSTQVRIAASHHSSGSAEGQRAHPRRNRHAQLHRQAS
jgi:hypothetical protein